MNDEDILLEQAAEAEEPEPAEEPVTEPEKPVDIDAIRAEERQRVLAEIQAQTQPAEPDSDDAEIEAIAELAYSNPVEAERRRIALADKRAHRTIQAQYGQQLMSSGLQMAVSDAEAKFAHLPEEVRAYVPQIVRSLNIQNAIPNDTRIMEGIEEMAYGKAAKAGKIGQAKPTARTVAVAGAERGTVTVSTIPAAYQGDATEFEKAFGKDILNETIKEIELA